MTAHCPTCRCYRARPTRPSVGARAAIAAWHFRVGPHEYGPVWAASEARARRRHPALAEGEARRSATYIPPELRPSSHAEYREAMAALAFAFPIARVGVHQDCSAEAIAAHEAAGWRDDNDGCEERRSRAAALAEIEEVAAVTRDHGHPPAPAPFRCALSFCADARGVRVPREPRPPRRVRQDARAVAHAYGTLPEGRT